MDIEKKAISADTEIKSAMDEFLNAFEHYKDANDERLQQIERKSASDPLLEDKVDRIDAALNIQKKYLDSLAVSAGQPASGKLDIIDTEHKSAFVSYIRSGDASHLNSLDHKGLSSTSEAEGGYLAPEETETLITAAIRHISPMRQIASVRQIGSSVFRKPVALSGAASGWVGETEARLETASPGLAAMDFPTMELYAMPATTQALLDDAIVDVEQWLADEVQAEFATQEGRAYVSGDGVSQPRGVLSYDIVDNAAHTWGQLGYIATGTDGDLDSTDPTDALIDLSYAPMQAYRSNSKFLLNRSVISKLRKLKDSDGHYLWQPSMQAGVSSTLLGYPVIESEDMPGVSAGSHSVVFGDFERGYLIVDRVGVRILRDPFSAKPYVLFYTTKRVGGGIQDFNALKVLKFSVS